MDASAEFPPGTPMAVVTTQPMPGPLDYRAPAEGCGVGDFVEVPLGPRRIIGVVWGPGLGDVAPEKLRAAERRLDIPALDPLLMRFLERAGAYTLTPLPAMLRLATRAPDLAAPPRTRALYRRADAPLPARMTEARARVLDAAEAAPEGLPLADLAAAAGTGSGVVKGLAEAGALDRIEVAREAAFPRLDAVRLGAALSPDQAAAAEALRAAMGQAGYGTTLLQGVTGSGKTEVYLEAVAACLARGRQALVLLPEIALTEAFLARVEARFGARPAEWHSAVTGVERRRLWRQAAAGTVQLTVGARSALFLPFRDLGLIVVDEEHESAYKQEDGVLYHARDMAVLRAATSGARVVLASATPALESWVNAQSGKYDRLVLPARFGAAKLPEMAAIDMRTEALAPSSWISPTLRAAIAARHAAGEQSLLFLNRRGYAPVTVCRACGQQIGCDQCDARMVEHRFLKRLVCHQCGASKPVPQTCPSCGAEGKLAAVGPGVERLAEEAQAAFPEARLAVLSSDLFASARELKAELARIADGAADIVIGTQLVAKGHNFPLLTLVGVVDADLGLQGSDLRAAERTFQLIRQVAGRAGRADRPGTALLQTFQPEHPVIRAILAGADEACWRAEAEERRALGMPPFGRMAGIVLSGPDVQAVFDLGTALARQAAPLHAIGAEVWGPAPAPIARIRGRHRVRLLVRAAREAPLQAALADWAGQVKLRGGLAMRIDIDPQSFL